MSEFKAIIEAKKFKHAVSVLRRVNDEAVIDTNGSMLSRVVDVANSVMVQVTISRDAFEYFNDPMPQKVGVDLDKVASIIKRASAKDMIEINQFSDDSWFFKQGIHQRTMSLLNPDRIRRCPASFDSRAASVRMTGKEFKDIIANAEDLKSGWLRLRVGSDGVDFHTESNDMTPDTYTATLPEGRVELLPDGDGAAVVVYSLELLQDIAADMIGTDDVVLQLSMDMPCEIGYTRDGVEIGYVVAPRIESD